MQTHVDVETLAEIYGAKYDHVWYLMQRVHDLQGPEYTFTDPIEQTRLTDSALDDVTECLLHGIEPDTLYEDNGLTVGEWVMDNDHKTKPRSLANRVLSLIIGLLLLGSAIYLVVLIFVWLTKLVFDIG